MSEEDPPKVLHVGIVGGGPGGIGPLVRAARLSKLDELLRLGVAVFEKQSAQKFGGGNLGSYEISSNTSASAFVNHFIREVAGESSALFAAMASSSLVAKINEYHHAICPLSLAGELFELAGSYLRRELSKSENCSLHFNTAVTKATLCEDGWEIVGTHSPIGGDLKEVKVKVANLVVAQGACQNLSCVDPSLRRKSMTGLEALTAHGIENLRGKLRNAKSRRVVIVGGSHTAFSIAWILLNKVCIDPESNSTLWNWKKGEVVIVHRSKIRLYYNSAAEAKRDNYQDVDDASTSHSGRINPFSGLRGDAKALYRDIMSGKEKHVQLIKVGADAAGMSIGKGTMWKSVLLGTEAIVVATGLQAAMIPLFDTEGHSIDLMKDTQGQCKLDDKGRLLGADGHCLQNVYGIGVGHGFAAHSSLIGGETHTSLRRADGVRMYVQLYGHIILSSLINLPQQQFPESPSPKKLTSPVKSPLPEVSARPAPIGSPTERSERGTLVNRARKERASTANSPGKKVSPKPVPPTRAPTASHATLAPEARGTSKPGGSFGLAFEASKAAGEEKSTAVQACKQPDQPSPPAKRPSSRPTPLNTSSAILGNNKSTPRRAIARSTLTVKVKSPTLKTAASPPADTKSYAGIKTSSSTPADTKSYAGIKTSSSTPADTKSYAGIKTSSSTPADTKSYAGIKTSSSTPADTKSCTGFSKLAASPKSYAKLAKSRRSTADATVRRKSGPLHPASPGDMDCKLDDAKLRAAAVAVLKSDSMAVSELPPATASTPNLLEHLRQQRSDGSVDKQADTIRSYIPRRAIEPAAAPRNAPRTTPTTQSDSTKTYSNPLAIHPVQPATAVAPRGCRHARTHTAKGTSQAAHSTISPTPDMLDLLPPLGSMGSLVTTSFSMTPPATRGVGMVLGLQGTSAGPNPAVSSRKTCAPARKKAFPAVSDAGGYARVRS